MKLERQTLAGLFEVLALLAAVTALVGTFGDVAKEALVGYGVPVATDTLGVDVGRSLTAAPTSMLLVVRSTPVGAVIRVNGEDRGVTPAVIEVACTSARNTVQLERQGFESWAVEVPCYAGTEARVDQALTRSVNGK